MGWQRFRDQEDVQDQVRYERPLGYSELAFIPQWSADGVGDMFLHVLVEAPPEMLQPERVLTAWAVLRARHPLLASQIFVSNGKQDDVRFSYTPPGSVKQAKEQARECLAFSTATKAELFDAHMNGRRTLKNDLLSHLTISSQPRAEGEPSAARPFDLFLIAPHFIGDGTTLHATADELVLLLSPSVDLEESLENALASTIASLPPAIESRLPAPLSAIQRAAQKVDFQVDQANLIGGHPIPREQLGKRRTVMEEVEFDEASTARLLERCKAEGVTVSSVMFVITAIAWARAMGVTEPEMPIMMYTALNLRSSLVATPQPVSYWFLALGYFNIVLPSFLPAPFDFERVFWHRARAARAQTTKIVRSPSLLSRCVCMAAERCARGFAKPIPPPVVPLRAPSKALCGLSLMGDLDRIYKHASYPPGVRLITTTTASRQRAGGLLLLEHTFHGRLWLHLAWDGNGFPPGIVERFWREVQRVCAEVSAGECSGAVCR